MNWKSTVASSTYQEALAATEAIQSPSVGFAKSSQTPQENFSNIIKQNNLIIQLLVKTSEEVQDLREQVNQLKVLIRRKEDTPKEDLEGAIESLTKRLGKLPAGETSKPQKKKPPFYVYKDPYLIFEEEKRRLEKK
nr:ORF2 [Gulupa bacilliform virus A]